MKKCAAVKHTEVRPEGECCIGVFLGNAEDSFYKTFGGLSWYFCYREVVFGTDGFLWTYAVCVEDKKAKWHQVRKIKQADLAVLEKAPKNWKEFRERENKKFDEVFLDLGFMLAA